MRNTCVFDKLWNPEVVYFPDLHSSELAARTLINRFVAGPTPAGPIVLQLIVGRRPPERDELL
jgi:hypothetical protein